jgi:DNA mismatch endonuclease (patch repair protein)
MKVAVFVDGCFWHACPAHFKPPRTRVEYWSAKIAGNQARDRDTDVTLKAAGWTVVRVWEHTAPEEAVAAIRQALPSRVA